MKPIVLLLAAAAGGAFLAAHPLIIVAIALVPGPVLCGYWLRHISHPYPEDRLAARDRKHQR